MNRVLVYLGLVWVSISVLSCQKEPDESILGGGPGACTLIKAEVFDAGAVSDTAGYVYTDNKITRANRIDFSNVYIYNGDRIVRRNYLENDNQLAYDTVLYNADGTIRRIQTYFSSPLLPIAILLLDYELSYSAGKLVRLVEKADTSFTGAPPVALYQYDYTYTGNNITSAVELDIEAASTDTLRYQYDNSGNYFKSRLLTDIFLSEINGQTLPFAFSANNVISIAQGGDNFAITYTLDDKKNLRELLIDGELAIRYTYKCQ
jgi:hypothetical protein